MTLRSRNLALLSKWWWKFHRDKGKQWMTFLSKKYGDDFIYGKIFENLKMSPMMKDIWKYLSENDTRNLVSSNMFK